jgi:hypothetical protein
VVNTTGVEGRSVLLLAGAVAVALGGVVGAFVGAQSAERDAAVVAFGALTLPSSPLAVGLYAAGLGALLVGALFGAVRLASRFDGAS